MNGVLLVDKPAGFTSFDVVAKLRGILHTKKIGHGGTLDPEATGVLPVFVGEATKLCDYLLCDDKCYEAGLRLGLTTDTEDIWGQVLSERPVEASEAEIIEIMRSFMGDTLQVPPMYSAKKVNGKKLYELARKGVEIEREAVPVHISDIEILRTELPDIFFRVACSKGTYIRTLCKDMGEKIGCGGCMCSLRRVRHGRFVIGDTHTLSEIQEAADGGRAESLMIPVPDLFDWPRVSVSAAGDRHLLNGNALARSDFDIFPDALQCLVFDSQGTFRGIYRMDEAAGLLKPEKMFLHD